MSNRLGWMRAFAAVGLAFGLGVVPASLAPPAASAAALSSVTAVSAGVYHNCALISGGTVECWGRNPVGSIGDGTTSDRAFPVVVQNDAGTGPLSGVTQISAGADVTCALLVDTSVHCWGDNFYGELGVGTTSGPQTCNGSPCSTLPVAVKDTAGTGTLSGVTKISAGQGFACALLVNTTAVCWGNSTFQSIARGPGANATRPSPLVVNGTSTPLSGITDISAGRDHSCALIVDGTARCWGHNFDGELGNNGSGDGYATVLNSAGSAPLGNITKIAAGYRQTCAVLGDQTARCWGYNYDGELGNGGSGNTDVRRRLPVTVISDTTNTALTGVDDIVTGSDHACALLSDNTARCWGSNGWLQLGNGDLLVPGNCTSTQAPCSTKATLVRDAAGTALNEISEVSAAMGYDTCARLSDGTAKCWGQNTYNEIGDGTAVHRCVPAAVGVQGPLPQAPGAPTGVSATKAVDKAIVHWAKQPGDCGTPVTKFTVTVSPGGQHIDYSGWTNGVYATSGEFEIPPGHPYTFTVTATNDAGTSPPSAKTNSVVALGEPSAPTGVAGVPGSTNATVSWKQPALTNGKPVTGYKVTWLRNNIFVDFKIFNSTATHQIIGGLKPKTKYTFKVAAINGYGTSPDSAASPAVLVGAPRAPTGVTVTVKKTNPRAIVVSYSAGANNGAPITKFTAACTSGNGGAPKLASVAGSTAKPITVSGVTPGKTYVCRVAATNSRGTGPSSAPSKAVVA